MIHSVFGLLIALGILVTIHEYGHFWVARRCGVKVLRFSVGFGQALWRKTDRFGTEFVIAWIPLGGYVKMLDEREGEVPEALLDQAFTRKTPAQKIAIALAGPIANLLFAIFAFALMYMIGVRDLVPFIDQPEAATVAAEQKLQRGDRILAVDGEPVDSFSELGLALASRVGDTGSIELKIDRVGSYQTVNLPIQSWLADQQSPDPLRDLGILPELPHHPAIIGRIEDGGAAQQGGLEVGDKILAVDGVAIAGWLEWVEVVQANPETSLEILVERNNKQLEMLITPDSVAHEDTLRGYVGAATAPVNWRDEQLVTERHWPHTALWLGLHDTVQMAELSYQMMWKMLTGKVSLKQVGGPIAMAQMAGSSIKSGFEAFISFLALISVSLAVLNLLPIPVLDGGHVVLHSLEWIIRRPLPEKVQLISLQIGMAFILALMLVVFYNDIGRLM